VFYAIPLFLSPYFIDNARGKKIIRLVRRVSGLLMQLTVFELPSNVAEAAYSITKLQLQAAAESAATTAYPFRQTAPGDGLVPAPPLAKSSKQNRERVRSWDIDEDGNRTERANSLSNGNGEREAKGEREGEGYNIDDDEEQEQYDEHGELIPRLSEEELRDIELRKGYAEERLRTTVLTRHPPPAFRIVGYDPRSKRKATLGVEPQAIIEIAGGVFSPYLEPERRKELAKVVCDSLVLIFPSGKPFDLLAPWSGAKKEISTAVVSATETKLSGKSSAERVLKRPGRLFRSALRISKYELLVSVYSHVISQAADAAENTDNRQLIFNFYSPAVSEAAEIAVTETQQNERLGRPVLHYGEGAQRAVAIRNLCRYFRADIIEDILDATKKTLNVVLLPPEKGFVTDYLEVSVPPPGEDVRPVGIPGVFFPLNTCGRPLHREGMSLPNRESSQPNKEYLITVYTKSVLENAERGLVIKLYDRSISETSVLHLGASELIRICNHHDEPDLLRDIVYAQNEEDTLKLDDVEKGFSELSAKGELQRKTQALIGKLMEIVLGDLGFYISPQETIVPYIRSGPRGIFPS
jgi:hypothetical protein